MVTDLCNRETREVQLEALFHDAGETYVGDWIRPLTTVMEPKLTDLRKRIQATCYQAAGLTIAPSETAPAMAEADDDQPLPAGSRQAARTEGSAERVAGETPGSGSDTQGRSTDGHQSRHAPANRSPWSTSAATAAQGGVKNTSATDQDR